MRNKYIQLVPANVSFAWQVADYYRRNKKFLEEFEPMRSEEFFSLDYQEEILKKEMLDYKEKKAFRFYLKLAEQPEKIIGLIGLNNVVWGAFCSAFLGYKLDEKFINQGYMSMAIAIPAPSPERYNQRNHRLIIRGADVESVAPKVRGMSQTAFRILVEQIFSLLEIALFRGAAAPTGKP